jgi:hypothetical protein
MKHIRADKTFIYYYSTGMDGQLHGLRFSAGTVAPFRGKSTDPEAIQVGHIYQLPVAIGTITEDAHSALGAVVKEHGEELALILGWDSLTTFPKAIKS